MLIFSIPGANSVTLVLGLDQFTLTSQEKFSVLTGVPVSVTSNPFVVNVPALIVLNADPVDVDTGNGKI
ncbi:hypothetical protein D3C84_809240 [compost metagenome]